ncbi:retinol dehydrogenase 12-like isoform X2 [Temnothorax longispinosus]
MVRKSTVTFRMTKDEYKNNVGELAIYFLDLRSFKSVRDCAKNLLTNEAAIHILINNAGVLMSPSYERTEDGNETTLQVNYLGHFLLTLLLLPKMQSSSANCRIINVSSAVYIFADIDFDDINLERSYVPFRSYAQSKLAIILFTKELARRLKEANIHGINIYSLHPGLIFTGIARNSNRMFRGAAFCVCICDNICVKKLFFKNVEQGAQTTIYCSVDEKTANETGLYYSNCGVSTTYRKANNRHYAEKLWNLSCRLLHLEPEENFSTFLKTVSRQML